MRWFEEEDGWCRIFLERDDGNLLENEFVQGDLESLHVDNILHRATDTTAAAGATGATALERERRSE